jgi:PAS domain-containing protein
VTLPELAQYITTIAAAVAGTGAAWLVIKKYIVTPVRHSMRKEADRKLRNESMLTSIASRIDSIECQFKPNGGSTMRDAVDGIDARVCRVEEAVQLHSQVSNLIMLDSGIAVFETDVRGDFVSTNRTYQRLVGRTLEEVRGKGWINCVAEPDRNEVFAEWSVLMGPPSLSPPVGSHSVIEVVTSVATWALCALPK